MECSISGRSHEMRHVVSVGVFLFVAIAICAGCAGPVKKLYPPGEDEPVRSVFVVSHGWHTGIVFRRQDIPSDIWPENLDFAANDYVEVGWGDEAFYKAPKFKMGTALKAVLWPTPSVLHIAGFNEPVQDYFPKSKIIELKLSQAGFERLCRFIHRSYAKDSADESIPLGRGLYGNSKFYLSREQYHLFKTCNVWTAKALRAAGCPITPFYALTTDNIIFQAGRFGAIIQ